MEDREYHAVHNSGIITKRRSLVKEEPTSTQTESPVKNDYWEML